MKMTKFYIVALVAIAFASCGPKEPAAKVADALPELGKDGIRLQSLAW